MKAFVLLLIFVHLNLIMTQGRYECVCYYAYVLHNVVYVSIMLSLNRVTLSTRYVVGMK